MTRLKHGLGPTRLGPLVLDRVRRGDRRACVGPTTDRQPAQARDRAGTGLCVFNAFACLPIIAPMPRVALALSALAVLVLAIGGVAFPTKQVSPESAVPDTAALDAPATGDAEPQAATLRSEEIRLRPRDTLIAALQRHGIPAAHAHPLAEGLRSAGADLRRMRAGDRIELKRDPDDRVVAVAYAPSAWQRFDATLEQDRWQVERTDIAPDERLEVRQGEVRQSLWDAVDAGVLSPRTLLALAQIFESEFDFASDTRPGDRFELLVRARYADGAFVEDGRIVAARYVGSGGTLTAVAWEVDGRVTYYGPDGRSLRKAFLRSPLEFTRISSGFTQRRMHPILGIARPHLAIDYAAPAGTPVWAVADGTVESAGWQGGNGIQVTLRHRAGYKTSYNHLSRLAPGIRPGVRVQQKQVIGYVGSTGLSTGPHLCYRVLHNGQYVNPLHEKFLPGEPIPAAQRAAFTAHAQQLLARLAQPAQAQPSAAPAVAEHPEPPSSGAQTAPGRSDGLRRS